jgi:hypothetical protein
MSTVNLIVFGANSEELSLVPKEKILVAGAFYDFNCTVGSGNLTNFLPQAVSVHSFKNFKLL